MLGITAISQDAIAALGTPTTFAPVSSVNLTTSIGTLSFIGHANITLTGVQAQTQTGFLQSDPDVIPVGQQLNTVIGPYSIQADGTAVILSGAGDELETSTGTVSFSISGSTQTTGSSASISIGTVDVVSAVNPTGVQANTTVNNVQQVTGTAVIQLTGVSSAVNLGEETVVIDNTPTITGNQISTTLGSVTLKLNTPVNLTGIQMSSVIRTPSTLAWSDVDINVTNTWIEVDIAA